MSWDFETDAEFQRELDWLNTFVREEVEPLDLLLGEVYDIRDERAKRHLNPLKERVKERGLWACHLGPDLVEERQREPPEGDAGENRKHLERREPRADHDALDTRAFEQIVSGQKIGVRDVER